MTQKNRTGKAYWRIRRAGIRGVRVCERHGQDAAIAPFTTTLPPLVQAYLVLFGVVRELALASQERTATAKALAAVLHASLVRWVGLLVRDLPGLQVTEFTGKPGVPDEVIRNSVELPELVELREQRTGQAPPYTEAMNGELDALRRDAEQANVAAQDALTELQQRRGELAESATAVHKELVSLRRVLRATLGASHRDYQKLRLERMRRDELDEDDAVDLELDGDDQTAAKVVEGGTEDAA